MTVSAIDDFEPVSRTYESQGLTLHYLDWGNEDAPLLLLLHGVRDHARSWDWTARALRRDWHVVALDLRGHGDSEWSPDGAYLTSYHLLDVADLIDTLTPGQLTIVGHSFGGNIAARYSAIFPDRVRKLALVDGLGPPPDAVAMWARLGSAQRTLEWIEKMRAARAGSPRILKSIADAAARVAASNPMLSQDQASYMAAHGVRRHGDGYAWKYDPLVSIFAPEDFSAENSSIWREITCPTLLFYGPKGWTTNPETDGRASHFRDQRTLVFEEAGHWIHHDQFDGFIAALRDFL